MRRTNYFLVLTALLSVVMLINMVNAQTNPTPQSLPYTQNFGSSTFSAAPTGTATWTVTGSPKNSQSATEASVANGDATIQATSSIQTQGGCFGYSANSNGRLYIQTSSNSTNGTNQFMIAINTLGMDSIIISYDIEMMSAQPRTIGTILQFRVGTSGSWTSVNGTAYSHNNSSKTNGDIDYYTDILLPTAVENDSIVQLRWAVWRGEEGGNSSGLAIDNISVSGTTAGGGSGTGTGTTALTTDTMYVTNRLKIGNSIVFDQPGNSMYTDSTSPNNLLIQSVNGLNHNTIINYDNSGKVGIGTTNPKEKLDVYGSICSGNDIGYVRTGFNSYHSFIDGFDTLTAGGLLINYYSGENTTIGGDGTNGLYGNFITNNQTYLAFTNGDVAIGSNSHQADLIVKGDIFANQIKADSGTISFVTVDEYGILHNQDLPGACTAISCTGNAVGINTDSPSEALEVEHSDMLGGIALNQTIADSSSHSEIKFLKNGSEKWSFGNDLHRTGKQTFFLWDHVNSKTRFFVDTTGYVGIGTEQPSQQFEVSHSDSSGGIAINQTMTGNNVKSEIKFLKNGLQKWSLGSDLHMTGKQTFFIWNEPGGYSPFFIDTTGYVGINNINPTERFDVSGNIVCQKMGINTEIPTNDTIYKLFVDGGIKTRDVKITATGWADYVFYDDYKLMPIAELEKFIVKNKHLPGIPSVNEIAKEDGFELGDMQKKLMEKLEEQALYIIMLQKQIDELKMRD